jgi:hypothetical protein
MACFLEVKRDHLIETEVEGFVMGLLHYYLAITTFEPPLKAQSGGSIVEVKPIIVKHVITIKAELPLLCRLI